MAKDRDHEIVRALGTHPKTTPGKIEIEVCVVTGLQVERKDIHNRALN